MCLTRTGRIYFNISRNCKTFLEPQNDMDDEIDVLSRVTNRRNFLHTSAVLAGSAFASQRPLSTIGGKNTFPGKQLFLDDAVIGKTENLEKVVNQPEKYHGNPIIVPDRPWEDKGVELAGSPLVLRDPGEKLFRMYYTVATEDEKAPHPYRTCYAESRDGLSWTKPTLGVSEFNGNRENNLIGFNQARWVRRPSVVVDPREADPNRRYKMIYLTLAPDSDERTISLKAYSADGRNWRMEMGVPILIGAPGQTVLGWVSDLQKWVMYPRPVIGPQHTRTISHSESTDLESWSEPQPVLRPDSKDPPGTHFASMPVFAYEGIYVGFLEVFSVGPHGEVVTEGDGVASCQLTMSRDAILWERVANRQVFLAPGGEGNFAACVVFPTAPLVIGDDIFVYYGGYNFIYAFNPQRISKHPGFEAVQGRRRFAEGWKSLRAIGVAKLRRDGWVSLDAKSGPGTLITRPFLFEGRHLEINADARNGEIRAELQDEAGRSLSAFTIMDCVPFRGSSLKHRVHWRSGPDLSRLTGRRVRLFLQLSSAKLFAFELKA
jgi:predicted GH43/DUF377 family glycosyl hydrolase